MDRSLEILDEIRSVFGEDCEFQDVADQKQADIWHVMALEKSHKAMKLALGARVLILRDLIEGYFDDRRGKMTNFDYTKRCEKYLDNILVKNHYQLNSLIDKFRCST